LKRVAGPEFARLSTGAPITRGNSVNGVLLIDENRAARQQKSRNGKGIRRGDKSLLKLALVPHTRGRSTLAALRFHNQLGRSFAHFEVRNHFLDFGSLPVEERFMIQTLPPQPE